MSTDLLASSVIPPRSDSRVVVGEYENEELVPRLAIDYRSEEQVVHDDVQWVESHPVMADGSIRVVVFVENYSPHEVTLYVRRAS